MSSRRDPLAGPPVPPNNTKPGYQTGGSASQQGASKGMAGKFASAFRRQTAEEREARRNKNAGKELGRSQTYNPRMDVIDKLDLSGIHGDSMFHHDSPYDACTPHANRSSKQAPVNAFDPTIDQFTGMSLKGGQRSAGGTSRSRTASNGSSGRRGPNSSLAAQNLSRKEDALEEDADEDVDADDDKSGARPVRPTRRGTGRSVTAPMVPSLPMTGNESASAVHLPSDQRSVTTADSSTNDRERNYYASTSTSRNAVSDMWGHTEEPWQDFAQPKVKSRRPSGANGNGSSRGNSSLHPYGQPGSRDGSTSAASSVLDMEALMTGKTSAERQQEKALAAGGVSPFPEPNYGQSAVSPNENGAPKRSKSLMRRIKSARQYGNVPPPDDDVLELQGRKASQQRSHRYSPSSPVDGRTGDWSNLTATNLGQSASGNLGRSGTRRPTRAEQNRSPHSPPAAGPAGNGEQVTFAEVTPVRSGNGYFDSTVRGGPAAGDEAGSPDEGYGSGSGDGRKGGTNSANGAGLGRSGSIFGRFGRKKSHETRVVTS